MTFARAHAQDVKTSAKAVLSRDLALLKGVNKAPADAPTAGEPSQLDGLAFEMIEKPSEAASNTESPEKARAAPSSTNTPGNKVAQGPQLSSVAMEKTESMSKADIKAKEHVAEEATVSAPKADSKADVKANEDAQKKSVADEQAVASKAKVEDESKTSPNDGNEQASDNGFNELLPGLSMYANDPGNDPPPLLEMDTLNDQSLSNAFGDGGENTMEDFEAGLFGDGDIGANSFADMISFDDTTQNDEGQNSGALDVFDENFFNLSGE